MLPPSFRRHSVTVEPLDPDGRFGPSYGAGQQLSGVWVEVERKLVASATGEELVSEAQVWLPPEQAGSIRPGDRVTLPGGHSGLAITVAARDSPGQLAHLEAAIS